MFLSSHAHLAAHSHISIYQAEVHHLSHAQILLMLGLFEVVIGDLWLVWLVNIDMIGDPKMTFKFGANNVNY